MNILEQREIHEPDSAQRSHYYKGAKCFLLEHAKQRKQMQLIG